MRQILIYALTVLFASLALTGANAHYNNTKIEENTMNKITVYHKPTCPFCKMAFHLLEQQGIKESEITKINVAEDDAAKSEMLKQYGRTVPQIIVNGHHVGGCDDLMDTIDQDKFKKLLK